MKTLLSQNNLVFNPPILGCVLFLSGLPGSSSKIYDRSPYGNHGTITGATWKRLPSGLWYLDYDGTDDYVNCGDDTSLLADILTIETWYQYHAGNNFILTLWNNIASDNPVVAIRYNAANPILYFSTGNYRYYTASADMYDGNWHHFVAVITGWGTNDIDNNKMYVDGKELTPQSATKTSAPTL